jgi:hypothetical protein
LFVSCYEKGEIEYIRAVTIKTKIFRDRGIRPYCGNMGLFSADTAERLKGILWANGLKRIKWGQA